MLIEDVSVWEIILSLSSAISYSLIYLKPKEHIHNRNSHFKFINVVTDMEGFVDDVKKSLKKPMEGGALNTL